MVTFCGSSYCLKQLLKWSVLAWYLGQTARLQRMGKRFHHCEYRVENMGQISGVYLIYSFFSNHAFFGTKENQGFNQGLPLEKSALNH